MIVENEQNMQFVNTIVFLTAVYVTQNLITVMLAFALSMLF